MTTIEERFGSYNEHRVLANVPRYWAPDATVDVYSDYEDGVDENGEPTRDPVGKPKKVAVEDHMREVNGLPDDWTMPRSITEADLIDRVRADDGAPNLTARDLEPLLASLADRGYIDRAGDAVSMTPEGFAALTDPTED